VQGQFDKPFDLFHFLLTGFSQSGRDWTEPILFYSLAHGVFGLESVGGHGPVYRVAGSLDADPRIWHEPKYFLDKAKT
jgi:hypothetical protein